MCGIIGYIGNRNAQQILIEGLKRLEYRGYDSAGIGLFDREIKIIKTKGEVKELEKKLTKSNAKIGVGHTRWATHGEPSDRNAHPFYDCTKKFALLHNGIIENYAKIKQELIKQGHRFSSETDTEVLVHLIEKNFNGNVENAVIKTLNEVSGGYAIVVLSNQEKIVAVKNENPLIIGIGKDENFIASDIPAILKHTNKVIYLEDKEVAVVEKNKIKILKNGKEVKKKIHEVEMSIEDAEKGGYEHFMQKEIFEQPRAISDTLIGREEEFNFNNIDNIKIVACGTSFHAGLTGKYIIEKIAKFPVNAEISSEYRYSSFTKENPLIIAITQSGETADTLAAIRESRKRGYRTIAITNVVGSSITREAEEVIFTRARAEIGVAATKTFTTQLICLYLLAIEIANLNYEEKEKLREELRRMPRVVQKILDATEEIKRIAKSLKNTQSMFFIGRNLNYPIALEGALKMKEISYIHAEGYSAGELKHGPLALLTNKTPVVCLTPRDETYEKMLGNIGEVSARKSKVIAVAFENDNEIEKYAEEVIRVPDVISLFSPIPNIVALQLLSYYTAKERNCEIDKPRNLAKSVTVE